MLSGRSTVRRAMADGFAPTLAGSLPRWAEFVEMREVPMPAVQQGRGRIALRRLARWLDTWGVLLALVLLALGTSVALWTLVSGWYLPQMPTVGRWLTNMIS